MRVLAVATVTAILYRNGELCIVESGSWNQDSGEPVSYQAIYEDLGTCEPQELMAKLVGEMQDRI